MKKVGDYNWVQLSMWDFAPETCIETFVRSNDNKHVFHFYLQKITHVVDAGRYNVETVTSLDDIPEDTLNYRNGEWQFRKDYKVIERKPVQAS